MGGAAPKNKTAALEARTAVEFLPGEDGQLACLLIQMTVKPRRDAAMAPVWPGMVLLRRWRSRTVVRLVLPRAAKRREKNFMTHLHAWLHGMPSRYGVGQAVEVALI